MRKIYVHPKLYFSVSLTFTLKEAMQQLDAWQLQALFSGIAKITAASGAVAVTDPEGWVEPPVERE